MGWGYQVSVGGCVQGMWQEARHEELLFPGGDVSGGSPGSGQEPRSPRACVPALMALLLTAPPSGPALPRHRQGKGQRAEMPAESTFYQEKQLS